MNKELENFLMEINDFLPEEQQTRMKALIKREKDPGAYLKDVAKKWIKNFGLSEDGEVFTKLDETIQYPKYKVNDYEFSFHIPKRDTFQEMEEDIVYALISYMCVLDYDGVTHDFNISLGLQRVAKTLIWIEGKTKS